MIITCLLKTFRAFPDGPQQMEIAIVPDVGATDSPQYYADLNPMVNVEGSNIPEDLIL